LRVNLVVNPAAGRNASKYIRQIESVLKVQSVLKTFVTRKKGDACKYARRESGGDRIIIAGGDGTINEVINGILSSDSAVRRGVPLAVIPLGTANVLARELNIPEKIEDALNLALTGSEQVVSLGRINGRYFSLMAGIGFDGDTVAGVEGSTIKNIAGKAAYIFSGINVLRKYAPPLITLRTPDHELSGYTAVIGNAHFYGGRFSITPRASITEPLLDICVFRGRTRMDMLRFVKGVLTQEHLGFENVSYLKTSEVEVSSEGTVHVQIDGDYFGTLPAKIEVIKDAVSFVR
jgi:YegS/Rv2252/BmrU family lipid kinase